MYILIALIAGVVLLAFFIQRHRENNDFDYSQVEENAPVETPGELGGDTPTPHPELTPTETVDTFRR